MLANGNNVREGNDVVFVRGKETSSNLRQRTQRIPKKIENIWEEIRASSNKKEQAAIFLDKAVVALGTYGIYYLTNQKSTLHAGVSTFLNLFLNLENVSLVRIAQEALKNINLVNFLALIIGTFTAIGAAAAALQGAKTQENPDGGFPLLDFYNITILIGTVATLILSAKTITTSLSHLLHFFNNLRKEPFTQEEKDSTEAADWLIRVFKTAYNTENSELSSAGLGVLQSINFLTDEIKDTLIPTYLAIKANDGKNILTETVFPTKKLYFNRASVNITLLASIYYGNASLPRKILQVLPLVLASALGLGSGLAIGTMLTNASREALKSLGSGNISVALGVTFMLGEAAFISEYAAKFPFFLIDACHKIYNLAKVDKHYKEAAASSLALVSANFLAFISASTILTQAKSATPLIALSPAALEFFTLMLAYSSLAANTPETVKALEAIFTTIVSFAFGNAKSNSVYFLKKTEQALQLENRLKNPLIPAPTLEEAKSVFSADELDRANLAIESLKLLNTPDKKRVKQNVFTTMRLLLEETDNPVGRLTSKGRLEYPPSLVTAFLNESKGRIDAHPSGHIDAEP